MTTLATLDGSLRTVDLGTLEAFELCAYTVGNDPIVQNQHAYHTVRYAPEDARKRLYYIESDDDERTTEDARDELEALMRETTEAMYELGYIAYWEESWFLIEIDDDESETNQ